MFHCFAGDTAMAEAALALGFHVSFAGIVTFPKAERVREAARTVPLDRLLVETDAPYLAPVPHRGRRNEPAFVVHVVEALARLRDESPATVAAMTRRGFEAFLGGLEPRVPLAEGAGVTSRAASGADRLRTRPQARSA